MATPTMSCIPDGAEPTVGSLLDYFPIPAFIVSPEYRIQRVSDGLLRAWSCSRGDFIDQDLFVALYKDSPTEQFDRIPLKFALEKAIHTQDLRICHAAYVAHGLSWTARIIPVHKQDKLLCFIFEWEKTGRGYPITDADVIQREASLDDPLRILIQVVKDYAIFLLDTRGNVVTWNAGAELNKGYTREEILGKHFSIFYGEDDLQAGKPEKELEICLREGTVQDEGWRYRRDGSRFWANVVITAIYKNNVHVGFGKVTRNLTERKEAEIRLIAAYEESNQLKNDFLANISHEIRTPMHGMLSACSLLLDSELSEEQRETANIIQESGQVLLQVINDILDYSKLAAGEFSISHELVDIGGILSSVVRSVQMTVQPGVSMKLSLAPGVPKFLEGDPLRYRQIAENIIGNAGKFTEEGLISVYGQVLSDDEDTCTILTEVRDTGHGVSEEAAGRLFKPFTQLDTTYQKRRQGTGLGLSIAKSLVELMGGNIGFRVNPEQQGSIFWFSVKFKKRKTTDERSKVPTEVERKSEQHPQMDSKMNDATTQLKQLKKIAPTIRILAAEDNIINQKVLVGMLHGFGFENITVVADGGQAVATLVAAPEQFELVLMDISMPVMNGYEATVRIREAGIHLPIIAMTAYALKGDMDLCLDKGMDDYIAKPMNKQVFMKKLLRWVERPSARMLASQKSRAGITVVPDGGLLSGRDSKEG